MGKSRLDFFVIGAQKAGTTSLFRYMAGHPALYLPADKEAPFFSWEERYRKGWSWYLAEFFGRAPSDCRWGTVTPQYMCYAVAAERLSASHPEARLIAILRDPIARTLSHYRMSVRRGIEARGVREMLEDLLSDAGAAAARQAPTDTNAYVAWSEYGRILSWYDVYHRAERLLVLYTRDLESAPDAVMERIWRFLEVDPYRPPNLGEVYHRGGIRERLPWISQFMKVGAVRRMWHTVPGRWRRAAAFRFKQWNVAPDDREPELDPELRALLQAHFRADAQQLADRGIAAPWFDEARRL